MKPVPRPVAILIGLLILLLTACGASVPDTPPTSPPLDPATNPEAYPPPQTPTPFVYPEPEDLSGRLLIAIDRPVFAGDTSMSGVGPADAPFQLVNMTTVGGIIAESRIGSDGTFSVTTEPLPAGVRIGLIVDLEAAGLTDDDIIPGEGAFSMPRVGYAVDTVITNQP